MVNHAEKMVNMDCNIVHEEQINIPLIIKFPDQNLAG